MAGIDKTLEVFSDLKVLAISAVELAKNFKRGMTLPAILKSIDDLLKLGKSVTELVKDLPGALPELVDLDSKESAQIGAAAYDLVKALIEAIKGF